MLEAREGDGAGAAAAAAGAKDEKGPSHGRDVLVPTMADLASHDGWVSLGDVRSGRTSRKYLEQFISLMHKAVRASAAAGGGYRLTRASLRSTRWASSCERPRGRLRRGLPAVHQRHILLADGYLLDSGRVARPCRVTSAYLDDPGGPSLEPNDVNEDAARLTRDE